MCRPAQVGDDPADRSHTRRDQALQFPITFDYLGTVTGQVQRGQISPGRPGACAWLLRFHGRDDVAFAAEGCTEWRYITDELVAAGVAAHLAEPADTPFARGRKRHAKTGKTDCRHLHAAG